MLIVRVHDCEIGNRKGKGAVFTPFIPSCFGFHLSSLSVRSYLTAWQLRRHIWYGMVSASVPDDKRDYVAESTC
jgi:hypothetical protein